MSETKKTLFVCTANLCRSPMAEAIFNDLADEAGLPFEAESAGVSAREGYDMAPYAREALSEIGVRVGGHRSRRTTERILDAADLILVMGRGHAARVEEAAGASYNVHLVAGYAGDPLVEEVPDPYGLTLFAYRASARQIYGYVERTLDRMEKEYAERQ